MYWLLAVPAGAVALSGCGKKKREEGGKSKREQEGKVKEQPKIEAPQQEQEEQEGIVKVEKVEEQEEQEEQIVCTARLVSSFAETVFSTLFQETKQGVRVA
ncbi:unnamed protein product [Heligmosomoides polygyrus]|uniref:Lipoprotein n=1 Tax=Heligmosomoides polygyrus TaxID=6339 RepID=A0A183GUK0_HELPZ|nr:unnamed protein product [Heligmosomoides polygyrus]